MRVEFLYFEGCPSHERLQPHLEDLMRDAGLATSLEVRRVESDEAAEAERFLGSPTVRINGRDIEPGADQRTDFGLKCRLYRSEHGASGVPPEEWITAALSGTAPVDLEDLAAAIGRHGRGSMRVSSTWRWRSTACSPKARP